MKEFWFTLLSGAAIASPVAWFIGRHGLAGAANVVDDVLDRIFADDVDVEYSAAAHPAGHQATEAAPFRHVNLLEPAERVR